MAVQRGAPRTARRRRRRSRRPVRSHCGRANQTSRQQHVQPLDGFSLPQPGGCWPLAGRGYRPAQRERSADLLAVGFWAAAPRGGPRPTHAPQHLHLDRALHAHALHAGPGCTQRPRIVPEREAARGSTTSPPWLPSCLGIRCPYPQVHGAPEALPFARRAIAKLADNLGGQAQVHLGTLPTGGAHIR